MRCCALFVPVTPILHGSLALWFRLDARAPQSFPCSTILNPHPRSISVDHTSALIHIQHRVGGTRTSGTSLFTTNLITNVSTNATVQSYLIAIAMPSIRTETTHVSGTLFSWIMNYDLRENSSAAKAPWRSQRSSTCQA